MSGKSAGQLAYEAYTRAVGLDPADWPFETCAGDLGQQAWAEVANAVETEQVRLARADRDQLRKAVLGLAAELEDEAAADERRVRPEAGSAIRARVRGECAARLRKIAEPPS